MEFSKFRESGDFSDISITVGSKKFYLHKFPLCAKSEYFCELAKSDESSTVELKDFPGDKDTFDQVANFCYNMPVKLTKDNIVETRAAAGYLKMTGSGNLIEVSEKCLHEILASIKLSRSASSVIDLLKHCDDVGTLAETEGVVDRCVEALVDCWVKGRSFTFGSGNAFSRVAKRLEVKSVFNLNREDTKNIMSLRPDWFVKILTEASSRGIQLSQLGALAVEYISTRILLDNEEESSMTTTKHEKDSNLAKDTHVILTKKPKDLDEVHILDKVLLALPEQAYRIPAVTLEWLNKVLHFCDAQAFQSRETLVLLAGELIYKLGSDELSFIPPSVLHDIVLSANSHLRPEHQSDQTSKIVDSYMSQMSLKGTLTSETFRLLVSATKTCTRPSHDSLFNLLRNIIMAERDTLTDDQISELTDLIDAELLSETCLQKALEENILPSQKIAKSALKLCSKLRAELLIHKYRNYRSASPISLEPLSSENKHFSSFMTKEKAVDLGCTDDSDVENSPAEALRTDPLDLTDRHSITQPIVAAKNVLTTARHKLSDYKPRTSVQPYRYSAVGDSEVSLDEELEPVHDWSLRSFDPNLRYYRLLGHYYETPLTGRRNYFPYSWYSRF